MTLDATPARLDWLAIAGVIATVAVFAIAQGLSYPLLSFILQKQGVSPTLIGLSAAMTPIGFMVSSPLIPGLARRFGAGRTALACAALSMLVLAAVGLTQNVWLWFPLRFLIGVVTNPLYVLSEVWMIALAPPARRGRIMGIYTTVISGGFASGPLCLLLVGTEGFAPFLVGIGAFATCGIVLASVLHRLPDMNGGGHHVSVLGFLPLAPLLLVAVVVAAGFEQAVLALLPVYGSHHGIDEARTATLLTIMIAGNIAMQVPLGLFAERHGAATVRLVCLIATVAGCALLPAILHSPLVWPVIFIWGAVSYGIYTMSIIELGERFSGPALVAGNAAFSLMWGAGGILLPPTAGAGMDAIGPNGLLLTLGAACAALAVASAFGLNRPRKLD